MQSIKLAAIILLMFLILLKKVPKMLKYASGACIVIILILELIQKNNNFNRDRQNKYLLSVITGQRDRNDDDVCGSKIGENIFVPTDDGTMDRIFPQSSSRCGLESREKSYGSVSFENGLRNNGFPDVIIVRASGVYLYRSKGNGKFEKKKLMDIKDLENNEPVGVAISDNKCLKTSKYTKVKNGKVYHVNVNDDGGCRILGVNKNNNIVDSHVRLTEGFGPLKKTYDAKFDTVLKENKISDDGCQIIDVNKDGIKDHLYVDVEGPVKVKDEKILNFFSVDLPKHFRESKVRLKAGGEIYEKVFNGYVLTFNVGNCKKIDQIDINTKDRKKYVIYNKDINCSFVVLPINKNINEIYGNVTSYYHGDRGGHGHGVETPSCIKKLEYKYINNTGNNFSKVTRVAQGDRQNVVNLTSVGDPSLSPFRASYSRGARGEDYYDANVNHYKAPIYIGEHDNDWKTEPCIQKLEYKYFNNVGNNFYMKGKDKKNDVVANLLQAPNVGEEQKNNVVKRDCVLNRKYVRTNNKGQNFLHQAIRETDKINKNDKVNLIMAPEKQNTYNATYYSMNRLA